MISEKTRPVVERIARLEGCTTYRDPRDGLSGGTGRPPMTDQDIAAALAMVRRDRSLVGGDVGPELLETYFGSTQRYRTVIRHAYLSATSEKATPDVLVVRRMAATLAAQELAGLRYSRTQMEEYAFIVRCRRVDLEHRKALALEWYMARMDEALGRFAHVVESVRRRAA